MNDTKPDLDHPCKDTCSGWRQGYERGVSSLKAENERLKTSHALAMVNAAGTCSSLAVDRDRLSAMCEKLAGALEFYAALTNWRTVTVSNKNQRFCILTGADLEYFQEPNQDSYCGKRARKALAEYRVMKGERSDPQTIR